MFKIPTFYTQNDAKILRCCVIAGLRSVVGVELWIEPAGPVLEGSTVTINCRVTDKHPLDVVRLVRVVDNIAYELTTNELLSSTFSDTGRYRIMQYDPQGLIQLRISR